MAANTAEIELVDFPVYGDIAYDLNRVRGYGIPEETVPQVQPREYEQTAPRRKTARGYAIAPATILGFAAAAVLTVFVLLSYVKLAEISAATTTLNRSIAALTEEHTQLEVKYQTTFNLAEVENYAVNTLGMVKRSDANTTGLKVERNDKAEILGAGTGSEKGLAASLKEHFSSLLEYLK